MPALSTPPCFPGKPNQAGFLNCGHRPPVCWWVLGGLISKGGSYGNQMDSPLAADESYVVSEQRAQFLRVGN